MDVKGAPASMWDGHVAVLYSSEREHDASVAAWIRRGVDRGEQVILTRLPDEPEDRVVRLCAVAGVDPVQQRRDGRVLSLPPTEFYSPQGQDEVIARGLAAGFSGVRLSAQAATALSIMSESDYEAAEHAMDRNCRSGPVSVICAYRRPAPTDGRLRATLATHSGGVRAVGFSSLRSESGARLFGEVDLVTSDVLAAALDAAVRTMPGADDLVLDLSGLDFIDVAGSRTLLRETAELRAAGGIVTLARTQRSVARALRLMDVDRAPGLRLVEDRP